MTFEHKVFVSPSFEHIRPDPKEDYGIGACRIWFYCVGPKGVVQYNIGTNWYIDSAYAHLQKHKEVYNRHPQAQDLGYHAKEKQNDSQTPMKCHLIEGGQCYYDGSSLNADEWLEGFRAGGTDWLWPKLEEYYRYVFENGEYPDVTPQYQKHPSERK